MGAPDDDEKPKKPHPGMALKEKQKALYLGTSMEVRASLAWNSLSLPARQVIDRLEFEHLQHFLHENGKLKCTYDDFVAWGMRRSSVRKGLECAVALGFVVIERRGYKAVPSLYRLTYVKTARPGKPAETNDWRKFNDPESVEAALKSVRDELGAEQDNRAARRAARKTDGISISQGRKHKVLAA